MCKFVALICFLCMGFFRCANAQDTVCYVFNSKLWLEKKGNEDVKNEFKFYSYRIYSTTGLFVEQNLFSGGQNIGQGSSCDTFEIKKGTWYIVSNGKRKYFFSVSGFRKKKPATLTIASVKYYLRPGSTKSEDNHTLYELYTQPVSHNDKVSNVIRYLFDPAVGIVQIITGEVTLVRRKYINCKAQ